jgi:hypothetical protein
VVRILLARQGVEVNKTAQNGATALMVASQNGHVDVVGLLKISLLLAVVPIHPLKRHRAC